MKKRGFTLAEVMVALTLIGIVASLTIPTFISDNRNKANASKLAVTVTAIEEALTSMIVSEGADDLTETAFYNDASNDRWEQSSSELGKYLKLSGTRGGINEYYSDQAARNHWGQSDAERIYEMKNGALLLYSNYEDNMNENQWENIKNLGGSLYKAIGFLGIDVNGTTKPNKWGRDSFLFAIGADGHLYPAGGRDFAIYLNEGGDDSDTWQNSSSGFACTGSERSEGCTARLIENNYEIDF